MVVTRFAPSPTGYLHIGGLRTALFNYLWARKNGGKFLLRIEDTDLSRNSKEAMEAILEAFKWVGLDFDEDVFYQSQRFELYKKYIAKLLDEKKAYYCYMSKEELDNLRQEQIKNKQKPMYDNRYRDFKGTPPKDIEPVIRLKTPLSGEVIVKDGIKGDVLFRWNEIDDFIIARSDGSPTYNFVVAIDDALMGVRDVIRGDDHLSNTPKQIAVYQALGFEIPNFYHVPMIHNEKGKKLSKRDGAMDVMEYKKEGYLPEALLNFLVRLGWSHKDQEIFSLDEMLELFDPKDINKSASSYNLQKLQWLNTHYIKNSKNEKLYSLLYEDFKVDIKEHDKKELLLDIAKERAKTIKDLAINIQEVLQAPKEYNEKDIKKSIKEDSKEILLDFVNFLDNSLHLPPDFQMAIDKFLKQKSIKMPLLGKPLRIALFGKASGANLADMLAVLGIEEIKKRVDNFCKLSIL